MRATLTLTALVLAASATIATAQTTARKAPADKNSVNSGPSVADPGNTYSGYPEWARRAFVSRGGPGR